MTKEEIKDRIIKNLISHRDFLNEYCSYLLGLYTEEQFDKISDKYTKEYEDDSINIDDFILASDYMNKLSNTSYTALDIKDLLNISHKKLELLMNQIV